MRLTRQADQMNVVPHAALTVVARHNFGTPKDDIRIIKSHIARLKTAGFVGYGWTGLDAKFDVVEMDLSSAANVSYTGGVYCDTLRLRLPRYSSITPPYILYPLRCKRLEVELGSLKNMIYLVSNAGQPSCWLEELELTGVGYAT